MSPKIKYFHTVYLRRDCDRLQVGCGWVGACYQLSVDVTVQLVVDVIVAHVLERGAASCTLKTFDVQVLVLDSHKHASAKRNKISGCCM